MNKSDVRLTGHACGRCIGPKVYPSGCLPARRFFGQGLSLSGCVPVRRCISKDMHRSGTVPVRRCISKKVYWSECVLVRCICQEVLQSLYCACLKREDVPLHPALVVWDVFSVQQFVRGRVFAQAVLWRRTGVHERLSHHRQTRVCDAALMDVEHKLRVFDNVHPEAQRKTKEEEHRVRLISTHTCSHLAQLCVLLIHVVFFCWHITQHRLNI